MSISSLLLIKLGTSVAKATLKVWLQDFEFAQDLSSSITEILGKKFEDIFTQRRTERFFERIAEEIAEEINKQLKNKDDGLTFLQKEKLTKLVIDIFNEAKLSKDILFDKDLDPLKLYNYIKSESPVDISESDGIELTKINSIILECCNYIIEIISTLPDFDLKKTQELLKRETESIELIKKILENLPISSEKSGREKDDNFEKQYRRTVARKLDSIELFGITLNSVKSRYNLSIAYISLGLTHYLAEEDSEHYTKAETALSASSRLLIRGEPGSGKTTLLQWIAVNAIRRQFIGELSGWNNYVPFFIRLRNYSNEDFPTPAQFIDSVAKNSRDYMPKGWVNRKLESEKCLILIDGVDELPPNLRDEAEEWIADLTDYCPNCVFIISSRPSAIECGWLNELGFEDLMLQPMSIGETSKFIDHWYEAAEEIIVDSDTKIEKYKKALKLIIRDTPSIRNLASTPLLCAMLCVLNIDRKSQIPKDRMELYRISLETLLDRRDIERKINMELSLSRKEKELLLQDLSYWLIQNSYTDCLKTDAVRRISKGLHLFPRLKRESPKGIFNELLERSGLLREPTVGRINFIHKTFQEYLSAKMAIEEDDIGVLIKNSNSDQWKEVIVLAAGHANIDQLDRLISGLLKFSNRKKVNRKKIQFLAVACMETATQLSKDTSNLLDKTSKSLFPPASEQDAKDLSSAGEGVIDYLTGFNNESNRIVKSCIRTLTWIGGARAIQAISEYSHSPNDQVMSTLVLSWDYFDQLEYAEKVFINTNYNGSITVYDKYSFEGLDFLNKLSKLTITECSLYKFSSIGRLKSLRNLTIERCNEVHDLSPIGEFKSLTHLTITDCNVNGSFDFLKKLSNIEYLDISGCIEFEKVSTLSKLRKLRVLNIDGCYGVTDLSPLSNLSNLRKLVLPELGLIDTLPQSDNIEVI